MSSPKNLARKNPPDPAILFDLGGTLLDTVYNHVTARSTAVASAGFVVPSGKSIAASWIVPVILISYVGTESPI
jgi:hypothetical protein